MKVLRLQSENIMRLVAVDITPQGHLVIVGGKNSAGKSSVLDSIAMALGGKDMCPPEPIRDGESEGKITVTLDDMSVTRRFYRERNYTQCDQTVHVGGGDVGVIVGHEHNDSCAWSWSDTKSTLVVKNKDGNATFASPQGILDKMLGKLTFDPLAFRNLDPKPQDEMLRKLVGIDVAPIERQRKTAFDDRAALKRVLATKEALLTAMPKHEAPDAEIPMEGISQEMLKAEEYRKIAEEAERNVAHAKELVDKYERAIQNGNERLVALEIQIGVIRQEQLLTGRKQDEALRDFDAFTITAQSARLVVPDPTTIRQKLTDAEALNAKVRANNKRAEAANEVAGLGEQIAEQDAAVKAAEEAKRRALNEAIFPVDGLGVSDNGVTFNGLPFRQASSSEQLRVSVAIGLALNPTLKVLLVRNGNLLDDDNLQVLAKQAEGAGAQVWCEYVTSKDEGVQVMIEEGKVAEKETV